MNQATTKIITTSIPTLVITDDADFINRLDNLASEHPQFSKRLAGDSDGNAVFSLSEAFFNDYQQ